MIYVDTNIIVAYYCPESLSEKAENFLTTHLHPTISSLTELEFFSALSRKVREGGLARKKAAQIAAKFFGHVDGHFYRCISVERHHCALARDWLNLFTTKLKTLDSLHLAIASSEGFTLVTADRGLFESAKFFNIEAVLLVSGG